MTVHRFGLCGAAFGTLTAMAARAVYMAWYLSKNILHRKIRLFIKDIALNLIFAVTLILLTEKLIVISASNLLVWGIYAAVISICIIIALMIFNFVLHNTLIRDVIKKLNLFNT